MALVSLARVFLVLAWLPVLSDSAKITVRTRKETVKVDSVEDPPDGVIVRIIDPPQATPESSDSAGHDAPKRASSTHDHSNHAHDSPADKHGQPEKQEQHHAHEHADDGAAHEKEHAQGKHGHSDAEHVQSAEHAGETHSRPEHGHEHGEHGHEVQAHGDHGHGHEDIHSETSHGSHSHADSNHHGHDHAEHDSHGHGEGDHAHEGHGHHAPDDQTLTASYMLIGGVTLVMAMFYLVQHPDLDIRYYSWNILTLSACIFIAVLASDVVNQVAKRFLFSHISIGGWGNAGLCFGLAIMWFLASQVITAVLSGAFGEEAKEPKDASSEEERQELEELWEQREVAMKCWGGLVAHCAGFAIVATLASLQDSEPFASSPAMSLLVVPAALILVTLLYRLAAFMRKKISEMDDGVVSRGEALWDEISEEAENESLCLGLSFASVRSISFFAIGAMPDTHFHVYADVSTDSWHHGWIVLFTVSVVSMLLGIATFKLKEKMFGGHGHGHDAHEHVADEHGGETAETDEDGIRLRALLILTETFIMNLGRDNIIHQRCFVNRHGSMEPGGKLLLGLTMPHS